MASLVSEVVEPNFGMTVSPRRATLTAPLTYSGIRDTGHPNYRGNVAEFFTHNAPDYGEEDTLLGPPGTSIADRFRRMALALSLQAKSTWNDPAHTLVPWTRALATVGPEVTTKVANRMRNDAGMPTISRAPTSDNSLAGQYVGPNDMIAHHTLPGYIPRQDWQNAVSQDPFANLLGPMQKPSVKQPEPTAGF